MRANVAVSAGLGAVDGYIGGAGIRSKGAPYRKILEEKARLNSIYSLRKYTNPKGQRHAVNRWIKASSKIVPREVKTTTARFFTGTALSNWGGRSVKKYCMLL